MGVGMDDMSENLPSRQKCLTDIPWADVREEMLFAFFDESADDHPASIILLSFVPKQIRITTIVAGRRKNENSAFAENTEQLVSPRKHRLFGEVSEHGNGIGTVEGIGLEGQGRQKGIAIEPDPRNMRAGPSNRMAIVVGSVELDRVGEQGRHMAQDTRGAAAPIQNSCQASLGVGDDEACPVFGLAPPQEAIILVVDRSIGIECEPGRRNREIGIFAAEPSIARKLAQIDQDEPDEIPEGEEPDVPQEVHEAIACVLTLPESVQPFSSLQHITRSFSENAREIIRRPFDRPHRPRSFRR